MRSFVYQIRDEQGMHARPAGDLVRESKNFNCEIRLGKLENGENQDCIQEMENKGRLIDCRKIFGLMSMGLKKGDTVCFTFEGVDEDKAACAIAAFMEKNL